MTKRDYELIAQAIATIPVELKVPHEAREQIAWHVGRALLGTNPHFDVERFVRAATGADEHPHARERRKASLRAGKERVRAVRGGVRFGTLHPDGSLTNEREIAHAAIQACPFTILTPDHYRADGSCQCDDPDHRAKMIAEWGYTQADFERKAVRS
jgi:hypothetical protein